MSEPIEWLPDGTPYSPRFSDRYHSESGGRDQAELTFLAGCGLPEAWAAQPQWRILETGFGFGLNFLTTWATVPAFCFLLSFDGAGIVGAEKHRQLAIGPAHFAPQGQTYNA